MLTILFTILHVLVSLFLILVVLAQQGKGQDLASAFGGGGSQTAFGARGTATLLSKITAGAAALFVVTSLMLSYLRPVGNTNTVIPETAPATAPSGSESGEPPAMDSESGTEAGAEAEPPAAGDSQSESGAESPGAGETPPPPPKQN